MDGETRAARYRPIRDYAAIGDCHGHALVAGDGSIDWCCMARHDAAPVFCRLLDADRGGFFAIRPAVPFEASRRYEPDTNILRTEFRTDSGRVAVTDLMPVGRQAENDTHDYVRLAAPHWLIRRIEGVEGSVPMAVDYRPSADFARRKVCLGLDNGAVVGEGVPPLFSSLPFRLAADRARAETTVAAGERHDLVLAGTHVFGRAPGERTDEFLAATRAFWREWIAYCRYRGPHAEAVRRSALALKLMTYAPSGAVVAALTTSLPEEPGGERNWDYRFSWLRDSALTLYALAVLGYGGEAARYHRFLARAVRKTLPEARIMYGIEWETELDERTLDHLEGYGGSRPVRVGNGAHRQRQIDVFGQVLDLALLYERLGARLGGSWRRLLATLADFVCEHWHEPDQGLWEMRGPPRHHVHGKMMSWVALDRALKLLGPREDWARARDALAGEVREQGIDPERRHLRQAYDGQGADAAVLLAPMLDFPLPDGVLAATLEAVRRELGHGDHLLRYRTPDGLAGEEGAFLICSFWEVDALLADRRIDEAARLLDRLVGDANDVGLLAEELDPQSGAFLGNFPQAFTHLALIGSAANLEIARRRGPGALAGSYADRAAREVGATFGWRAVLEALRRCWRCGRVLPSRASVLSWP
jgi:alpha,alpha-trehalase